MIHSWLRDIATSTTTTTTTASKLILPATVTLQTMTSKSGTSGTVTVTEEAPMSVDDDSTGSPLVTSLATVSLLIILYFLWLIIRRCLPRCERNLVEFCPMLRSIRTNQAESKPTNLIDIHEIDLSATSIRNTTTTPSQSMVSERDISGSEYIEISGITRLGDADNDDDDIDQFGDSVSNVGRPQSAVSSPGKVYGARDERQRQRQRQQFRSTGDSCCSSRMGLLELFNETVPQRHTFSSSSSVYSTNPFACEHLESKKDIV